MVGRFCGGFSVGFCGWTVGMPMTDGFFCVKLEISAVEVRV